MNERPPAPPNETTAAAFPIWARKLLMTLLLGAFVVQTYLVYSDDTGRNGEPLSEAALAGRAIWLDRNCQACHQFYGFGGFLGPDLTNAAGRLTRARLDDVLTNGGQQMPAFHLSPREIDAVQAYLDEIDQTGVGQARARTDDPSATDRIHAMLQDEEVHDGVARGGELFLGGTCSACHTPLAATRIGQYVAPDLSLTTDTLSDSTILQVLAGGRPAMGMPPTGLSRGEQHDVLAFVRWLAANREALVEDTGVSAAGLPWFEFH